MLASITLAVSLVLALPGAAERRIAEWTERVRAGGPEAEALADEIRDEAAPSSEHPPSRSSDRVELLPVLEAALDSPDERVRSQALWTLAYMRCPEALPLLERALHGDGAVQALMGLGWLGAEPSVRARAVALLSSARDGARGEPLGRRLYAACGLLDLGEAVDVGLLFEALRDPKANEAMAAGALARLGRKDAIEPIIARLATAVPSGDPWCAVALERLTGARLGTDAARWRAWLDAHRDSLPAQVSATAEVPRGRAVMPEALREGARLSSAPEAFLEGIVVDPSTGRAVEDARVAASEGEGRAIGGARIEPRRFAIVHTLEDGTFRLPLGAHRGGVRLDVSAEGLRTLTRAVDARRPLVHWLALEAGLSLEGRVVVKGTREPLAGVRVVARQGPGLDDRSRGSSLMGVPGFDQGSGREPSAVTGADGRFRFDALVPGRVRVEVAPRQGWSRARADAEVGRTRDPVLLEVEGSARIVVRPVDASGRPVVVSCRLGYGSPAGTPFGGGGSKGSGPSSAPVFDDLDTSLEYGVSVSRVRGAGAGRGSLRDLDDAVFRGIRLAPGETRTLECVIDPSKDGAVVVRALDRDGRPLAGADVRLSRAERTARVDMLLSLGVTARTGRDGEARFDEVPPGRYEVGLGEIGSEVAKAEPFDLAPGESRTVELRRPGGRTLAGRVLDEIGVPIPRAQVDYMGFDPSDPDSDKGRRSTRTDAQGRFTLEGLPERPMPVEMLVAYAHGFEHQEPRPLADEPDLLRIEVRLGREAPKGKLTVRFRAAPPAGVAPPAVMHVSASSGRGSSSTSGEASVSFDLAPGRYRLAFAARGFLPFRGPEVEHGAGDTAVEVEVPLERGASCCGRVVDQDGAPVEGAWISVLYEDGDPRGAPFLYEETDAQGGFALDGSLPPRGARISVYARGYRQVEPLPVTADGPPVTVRLTKK